MESDLEDGVGGGNDGGKGGGVVRWLWARWRWGGEH